MDKIEKSGFCQACGNGLSYGQPLPGYCSPGCFWEDHYTEAMSAVKYALQTLRDNPKLAERQLRFVADKQAEAMGTLG